MPLFMRWPQRIAPGTQVETPVAHIDVTPTLAAAAGASLPDGVAIDGLNLLPAAEGEAGISRPDDAIFWQSGYYRVVRAGDWKLQYNGRQDRAWLYNLATDPTEQTNLADIETDKREELMALLDAHQAGARDPLYPYTLESPIMIDKTLAETYAPGDDYVYWPN